MDDVPKKANDASHVSLLKGLPASMIPGDLVTQLPIILHSSSQITKLLSSTKRERHLFLFENYLVIAKKQEYDSGSQNLGSELGSPGCGDETFRYISKHIVKNNSLRCTETVDNTKIIVQNVQSQDKFVISVETQKDKTALLEVLKMVE